MLPFHPILLFLAPVLFVGIIVRACLERVVTCSCRAVQLGVHATSFLLLASPLHLTISTQVSSISSGSVHWPQSYRLSFTQWIQVQQLSQHTTKGGQLPCPLNFPVWNAMRQKELLDLSLTWTSPAQPQHWQPGLLWEGTSSLFCNLWDLPLSLLANPWKYPLRVLRSYTYEGFCSVAHISG